MLRVRSAIPSGHHGTAHVTIGGTLPAVLLLRTNTLAADPTIEATRRDDGTYQFTLTSQESIGVAEAQAAILIQARQLCGNQMPELGNYRFSKSEVVKRSVDADGSDDDELVLVQDISCKLSPPTRDRSKTCHSCAVTSSGWSNQTDRSASPARRPACWTHRPWPDLTNRTPRP